MNVASLDNSRKLFQLSGWEDTSFWFVNYLGKALDDPIYVRQGALPPKEYTNLEPAYDLGFLLRKLPVTVKKYPFKLVRGIDDSYWFAFYDNVSVDKFHAKADTPEDAAAQLCIKLFEEAVL